MKYLKKVVGFLRDLLVVLDESKKAKALLVGLVVTLVGKLGFSISDTTVLGVLGLLSAYLIGQGVADNGKEALKLQVGVIREERDRLQKELKDASGGPVVVMQSKDTLN